MLEYQSAEVLPWKLIKQHQSMIVNNKIIPYCIHLKPTNKCNANCKNCSLKNRNKSFELSIEEIYEILSYFHSLGTKAISISGGGEPTIHPNFNQIIEQCNILGIKIGLTTNGITLLNQDINLLKKIVWIRLSLNGHNIDIEKVCDILPDVDLNLSLVINQQNDYKYIRDICHIANQWSNITHIRFVANILDLQNVMPEFIIIRILVEEITNKGIFQYRDTFTSGSQQCYISKLKPQIGADGFIYPCCGIQYANSGYSEQYFQMCHWRDFNGQKYFDGSKCKICYYNQYNQVLEKLLNSIKHKEFV